MVIKKILIANRGEIALRVMATCRELGIKTVGLYTEDDKDLPHALYCDQGHELGSGELKDTYLNQQKILEVAKQSGADAIHPGYGFLSENPEFCELVEKSGIIFIGPRAESMRLMGDKIASKKAMEDAQMPIVPGYHGEKQDEQTLEFEANKIGYPLMIKATAGGGGKGMRIVHTEKDFSSGLRQAKSEALKAFGNDKVLLEKYIQSPRHIEVQVLSDQHGQHFHFYERECSIQRRHQKIIEESPSPALTDQKRKEICETAANMAKAINYRGAGTVEFIYDTDDKFYFLEMNTRLQVEHPVTEFVTGHDLVKLQILVANGEKIPFSQSEIVQRGSSIECRVYAEDPDNNFMPTTGTINYIGRAKTPNVRLDCGYIDGNEVTINYDPMLAKLIVWGSDRDSAINKMRMALDDIPFLGLKTNRDYMKRVLNHPSFRKGETFTHFVETHKDSLNKDSLSNEQIATLMAISSLRKEKTIQATNEVDSNVWNSLSAFRNF